MWPWLQDGGNAKTPWKIVLFGQVCLHNGKLQGISETLQVLGPPTFSSASLFRDGTV